MALDPPICGKCGYDLSGLGRQGRCPECGTVFNLATGKGVRSASDAMRRGDRLVRRLRTIACALFGVAMLACAGCLQWVRPTGRSIWIGGVFAGMAFLAAVVSYIYEKDEPYD